MRQPRNMETKHGGMERGESIWRTLTFISPALSTFQRKTVSSKMNRERMGKAILAHSGTVDDRGGGGEDGKDDGTELHLEYV